jgi:hypothetical protein
LFIKRLPVLDFLPGPDGPRAGTNRVAESLPDMDVIFRGRIVVLVSRDLRRKSTGAAIP